MRHLAIAVIATFAVACGGVDGGTSGESGPSWPDDAESALGPCQSKAGDLWMFYESERLAGTLTKTDEGWQASRLDYRDGWWSTYARYDCGPRTFDGHTEAREEWTDCLDGGGTRTRRQGFTRDGDGLLQSAEIVERSDIPDDTNVSGCEVDDDGNHRANVSYEYEAGRLTRQAVEPVTRCLGQFSMDFQYEAGASEVDVEYNRDQIETYTFDASGPAPSTAVCVVALGEDYDAAGHCQRLQREQAGALVEARGGRLEYDGRRLTRAGGREFAYGCHE